MLGSLERRYKKGKGSEPVGFFVQSLPESKAQGEMVVTLSSEEAEVVEDGIIRNGTAQLYYTSRFLSERIEFSSCVLKWDFRR
jgi:hypothetical protein